MGSHQTPEQEHTLFTSIINGEANVRYYAQYRTFHSNSYVLSLKGIIAKESQSTS